MTERKTYTRPVPKRFYPEKCGNANRYMAKKPPQCNGGNPCTYCKNKWANRHTIKDDNKPLAGGVIVAPDEQRERLKGQRFVFTSAQNNTHLHEGFWDALQVFCAKNDAQLFVSRFTYNREGWARHGGLTRNRAWLDQKVELWYDPKIEPYVLDRQVQVAKGLVFCGELDILPTAAQPLNTLANYTGPNSGIVPHAKVAMRSLATMKNKPANFMYTTGACTQRNYIERKSGQVATFHHVFGALYVEIDDNGDWFARQLIADRNGVFYDLETAYGPGWEAKTSDRGEVIVTLGDIHAEKLDCVAWDGAVNFLQAVQPAKVFVHDLIDFEPRNHHNIKDPFFLVEKYHYGDSVEHGMAQGVIFMHKLSMLLPKATIYGVRSNHDEAFVRWLKDPNGVKDAANSRYWHEMNMHMLKHIEQGNSDFDIYDFAMRKLASEHGYNLSRVKFLKADESMVIDRIEYGVHGHRGPNGSKGSPSAYRQLGTKANTGHTHTAGIIDGVYTAGVLARLDMGYNVGPSSWSHSNIITYPSGKRAIVTQRGRHWRA